MAMLYTHSIGNQLKNMMVVFKMHDSVPSMRYSPFVMHCVYGEFGSSVLIEYRLYDSNHNNILFSDGFSLNWLYKNIF